MIAYLICLPILLTIICPVNAIATIETIPQEITLLYRKGDYQKVLVFLETRINAPVQKEMATTVVKQKYLDLLFCCYLRAWRLNDTNGALACLKKASGYRSKLTGKGEFPPVELLFAGEIYERMGKRSMAESSYKELLDALRRIAKTDLDSSNWVILSELARIVRYQIDGLRVTTDGKGPPLMPIFPKFDKTTVEIVSYLLLLVSPAAQYDLVGTDDYNSVDVIRKSTNDLASSILNFMLVAESPTGYDNPPDEKAMHAYLAKYGDGYCALLLRMIMVQNYLKKGAKEKAATMSEDIRRIADRRGIEVVLAPDPRLSSPERTWKTFLAALKKGDTETLVACFEPYERRYAEGWGVLSKEQLNKLIGDLGEIKRISGSRSVARYLLPRKNQQKGAECEIKFLNIDGEWRMDSF